MSFRFCRLVLITTAVCCLGAAPAGAQCTLASASAWNVISGAWNTASDWTPAGIPNNKNVCLTNGTAAAPATTTLSSHEAAANLQLGANNTLNVTDSNMLFLNAGASAINAGWISVNGTGSGTDIYLLGGDLSFTTKLTGGGTIRLANTVSDNTQIFSDPGVTLENVDNTIQGVGHIGGNFGSLTFRNDSAATVNANVSGGTLVLDTPTVINTGRFTATGGGTLRISTTVNNSGGTISTDAGSNVVLSNAIIRGGTLNGNVQPTAGSILDGVTYGQLTNAGNLTVTDSNLLTVGGTIFNSGTLSVSAAGSATSLYVGNGNVTTTLSGKGTLTLADTAHGGNALIYGDGGATLENVNDKIQGEGQIGSSHFFMLHNDAGGTVNANIAGRSLILGGGFLTNSGVLEATNEGRLEIATDIDNQGGTISSNPGSLVLLDRFSDIEGGTLQGTVQTNQTGIGALAILDGITNGPLRSTADITITSANEIAAAGTINNFGNLILNGGTLSVGSGVLTNNFKIEGTGVVSGSGTIKNNSLMIALGGTLDLSRATLADFSAGTLAGGAWWSGESAPGVTAGPLKLPGDIVTNAANIELIGSGAQIVDAGSSNALAGLETNTGTLAVTQGASLTIDGSLTNSGSGLLDTASGGVLTVTGDLTQSSGLTEIETNGTIAVDTYRLNGGTLLVDGLLDAADVIVSGGVLAGNSVIDADVTNAGSISPAVGGVPTILTINGDYTQSALGFFEEEIASLDDFGSLIDSVTAILDGTLDIALLNGYVPDIGSTFFFITAPAVNGVFAHVNAPINGLEDFDVIYSGSGVELRVEATPEPGSLMLLMGALLAGLGFMRRRQGARR